VEYRKLGSSGLQVSVVGLGTNNFGGRIDEAQSVAVVRQALDEGINFIDTANIYGRGVSEERIGVALKGVREEVLIATKVSGAMGDGPNSKGNSRHHIMEQVDASLRRLQTDYIDLYQLHFADPSTPIEETLRALDDLVHQGKVRYIGCSNFSAWQTCEAIWTSRSLNLIPFVSVQPEYSLLSRGVEKELIPFCKEYSLGVLPYFPLASGFLTGKYRRGEPVPDGTRLASNSRAQERTLTDANFEMLERLENFAEEQGHPMVELAIAWLLGNPAVSSVIAGATKTDQVIANAKASGWQLVESDMEEVASILKGN
jgi:aryl-alcohol dehydrogenase-like predicted oxidoreductase|tara:strand:+ start:774 stop:1715 length:942 start_codon:yes stop_codon:yes gene_type:complete